MRDSILRKGPGFRRAVLIFLIAAIPLLFLRTESDPFNVPKFTLLLVGIAAVAAVRFVEILQGAEVESLKKLWVPALAIAGPLTVAWIFSPYRDFALMGRQGRLQGLLPYLAVVILGILIADAFQGRPRPLLWALAISGYASGLYSLIQVIQADPYSWLLFGGKTTTAISTLGNPNFTGGFLAMVLPVSIVLWVTTPKHRKPLGFLVAAVAVGWVFANSQGGWLAGIAGLGVIFGALAAEKYRHGRGLGYLVAAGMAFISIGIVIAGVLGIDKVPATATSRGYWWKAAIRMAETSPIVGKGPNAFSVEGVQFRDEKEAVLTGYTFPDDPHSVPMSFLTAGGLLGLAGFVVMGVWAVRRGMAFPIWNLEAAAFLAIVVAYLVQALVTIDELSLRTTLWTGIAGLAVIVPGDKRAKAKDRDQRPAKTRKAPASRPLKAWPASVLATGVALLVAWWAFGFLIADARVNSAVQSIQAGDLAGGRAEFAQALDFRDDPLYRRQLAGSLAALATKTGTPELFAQADRAYDEFSDWPDVQVIVQHARLLRTWANLDPISPDRELLDGARDLFLHALDLDPRNPVIRIELSDLLVALDEPDEAVVVLEPSIPIIRSIGKRASEFWGALALARANAGDEAGARSAAELALRFDPGDTRAKRALALLESGP
jgi:tetratricopeptide (TPR) repeat protein